MDKRCKTRFSTLRSLTRPHLLVLGSLLPALVLAEPSPRTIPDFSASYELQVGFIKVGESTRRLVWHESAPHEYYSTLKATGVVGLFLNKSVTRLTKLNTKNGEFRPLKYHYEDSKGDKVVQEFDWPAQKVASSFRDKLYEYALEEDTLDQNIYPLQLMLDLARGETSLNYAIAENKRLKHYKISKIAEEKIDTPWGKFNTLVMHTETKNFSTTLWCAPDFYFLPLRIRHRESGITYTAKIVSLLGEKFPSSHQ